MIYGTFLEEQALEEAMIKNQKDILYNKEKFDSGEVNLLFVTGLSGSGKSTLSAGIKDKVTVDMDKVIMYNYRNNEFFKKEGPCVYGFITGVGSKYRVSEEEKMKQIKSGKINQINKQITYDLINYTKNYAAKHKDQKIVMDGVWLFMYCNPADFRNYAVYIKGTSAITSGIRAGKRGSNNDAAKNGKVDKLIYSINRILTDIKEEATGGIRRWYDYYKKLVKE